MFVPSSVRGFSLIEALLASALIAGAVASLAAVVTTAASQTVAARRTLTALVLAQAKLEELRAIPFRFGADGSRADGEALARSPASALIEDHEGWVEDLDRFGGPVNDRQPPHYRRRWAVTSYVPFDVDALVLQVCVFPSGNSRVGSMAEACVSAIRVRRP